MNPFLRAFAKRILLWAIALGGLPFQTIAESKEYAIFEGAQVPSRVLALLRRSCQACHSDAGRLHSGRNLSRVAGQLTAEGENTDLLNFSRWSEYNKGDRRGYLLAIVSVVRSGLMPPSRGWKFRRSARLNEEEKRLVADWAEAEADRSVK